MGPSPNPINKLDFYLEGLFHLCRLGAKNGDKITVIAFDDKIRYVDGGLKQKGLFKRVSNKLGHWQAVDRESNYDLFIKGSSEDGESEIAFYSARFDAAYVSGSNSKGEPNGEGETSFG